MKIILKEDVRGLGYKDDVVEVKDGYGRNYLIPQMKAVIANPSNLRQLEENKRQQAHKIAQLKADTEALAASLADVSLTIAAKAAANGSIYGSVTAAQIADALKAAGHDIDRKVIEIKGAVKELGKYTAKLNLHKEVACEIPFEVVAEEA